MFITAALIILHMFGKEVLFRNEERILRDMELFGGVAAVMLICRMFSGLYFENAEHINFISRSLIVVFSFLTARLNKAYEDRISETIG